MIKLEVSSLSGRAAAVIGDVMLDEHIRGRARRISPEAPVPIIEVESRTYHPGGAGNVAANLAAMNTRVTLAGIIGSDPQGEMLASEIRRRGVDVGSLVALPDRCTTTKTRVIAGGQHVVRFDQEVTDVLTPNEEDRVLAALDVELARAETCILSDYAKGMLSVRVCRWIIARATELGIPVVVDPKGSDFAKYRGCTLITPNLHEALAAVCAISGKTIREDESDGLAEELGAALTDYCHSDIVITRGAKGISVFERGLRPVHIPARARQVYDVTGAGDTVIAVMTLALASGFRLDAAARLGNYAASIVVGIAGTAVVTLDSLAATLPETLGMARKTAQHAR